MTRDQRAAPLPVEFFRRDAAAVARDLVGALVISRIGGVEVAGRIVETEAYLGYLDPASHGYRHRRHRQNESLYAPAGTWYVYRSYGIHWCTNLVCQAEGEAAAVLLRALEPVSGVPAMRRRRPKAHDDRQLCGGPGRLSQALGITRALDGRPMADSEVVVLAGGPAPTVRVTPRIGITQAADWPLRFVERESRWASR